MFYWVYKLVEIQITGFQTCIASRLWEQSPAFGVLIIYYSRNHQHIAN